MHRVWVFSCPLLVQSKCERGAILVGHDAGVAQLDGV